MYWLVVVGVLVLNEPNVRGYIEMTFDTEMYTLEDCLEGRAEALRAFNKIGLPVITVEVDCLRIEEKDDE